MIVVSPSEEDMRDAVETRLRFQENTRKNLREMKQSMKNEMVSNARQRRLQAQIEELRVATELVDELKDFDLQLGHVLATSGFRVAESGCGLDWGLVAVDDKRVTENIVSLSLLRLLVDRLGCY